MAKRNDYLLKALTKRMLTPKEQEVVVQDLKEMKNGPALLVLLAILTALIRPWSGTYKLLISC